MPLAHVHVLGRQSRNSRTHRGLQKHQPKRKCHRVIAQLRRARGSKWSQCSRRPTQLNAGIRGTRSLAAPTRHAHQLTPTAIAKASGAVYSASSSLPIHHLGIPFRWIVGMVASKDCMARHPACRDYEGAVAWLFLPDNTLSNGGLSNGQS